ncbi:MAG: cytochrome c-type biogenesis protein CcmH [Alphaproteobacteria bacterium]|nr:cytochrome c-type biogenesis protein CcmH [Alphaproteobacteria bacterium]
MTRFSPVLALMLLTLAGAPALAVNPNEQLANPAQESRALALSRGLRCVVCQNQSIDESNADLARDMRLVVRQRITAGDSDDQVVKFLVDRYGDFVTLKPPLKVTTYALWFGPALFLLGALGAGRAFYRRRPAKGAAPGPLTAEEQRRLDGLLKDSS